MKDHKAWCDCKRCTEAKKQASAGKKGRFLPKHVLNGIIEKKAREEESMLSQGKALIECPNCHHKTYMKIGPVMKCGCCMYEIK
jgi:protein-arginine kinase activator protein McsA